MYVCRWAIEAILYKRQGQTVRFQQDIGAVYFMTQTVDKTKHHHTVGKATRRQDGADKVKGRTRFAGDLPLAGLLHARLVHSPYAHARIVNIDTSAALEVPGVKAVYTSQTLGVSNPEANSRGQSPLASKEALWCGH